MREFRLDIVSLMFLFFYGNTNKVNVIAKCTMEKVLRQSGPFSNEGVKAGLQVRTTAPEHCDDEAIVKKRCNKLNDLY